jgi:hypothetical protein
MKKTAKPAPKTVKNLSVRGKRAAGVKGDQYTTVTDYKLASPPEPVKTIAVSPPDPVKG